MSEPRLAASPVSIDRARGHGAESQNAELFRLLVQSVRDYAVFVLDPDGHVLTWNPGAQAMKGYTSEEIIGRHFSAFYPPEAVQSCWPQRELALAEKEGRLADEGWRVRKDGTVFWASVVITALRDKDGRLTGFAKVTQDLTERRQGEERVQALNRELRVRLSQLDESKRIIELRTVELQKLSARLLHIQDEERRRLARELHDDVGQQLAALKMTLDHADGQTRSLVDSAIGTIRNLSYLLHPPLLDETGLRSALYWFVDGLAKRSNIEISLMITPQTFPRLDRDIETTIFRVVQESLTNVYRHADSESARVEVDKQPELVVIRVRDYGKGISQEIDSMTLAPSMGVGISGMRERLRQFGGDLTVSRTAPGTFVEAKIPLFSRDFAPL